MNYLHKHKVKIKIKYRTYLSYINDFIYHLKKKIKIKMKYRIYLDDVRTPIDSSWVVVRNYEEFVKTVNDIGLENIDIISLDHDLGDTAMKEWRENVYHNFELDYGNITEKTGYDCAKWLVEQWMDGKNVVDVYTHSANAIGSANICGLIWNYRHIFKLPQKMNMRWVVPFTI